MQEKIYDLLRSSNEENILLALELNNSLGNDLYLKGVYKLIETQKPIEFIRLYHSLDANINHKINCDDTIFEIASILSNNIKTYQIPYIEESLLNDRLGLNQDVFYWSSWQFECEDWTLQDYLSCKDDKKMGKLLTYTDQYRFLAWSKSLH